MLWNVTGKFHVRIFKKVREFPIDRDVEAITVLDAIQIITVMGVRNTWLYSDLNVKPIGRLRVENAT